MIDLTTIEDKFYDKLYALTGKQVINNRFLDTFSYDDLEETMITFDVNSTEKTPGYCENYVSNVDDTTVEVSTVERVFITIAVYSNDEAEDGYSIARTLQNQFSNKPLMNLEIPEWAFRFVGSVINLGNVTEKEYQNVCVFDVIIDVDDVDTFNVDYVETTNIDTTTK